MIEERKKRIKSMIEEQINRGLLDEAKFYITEYMKIVNDDSEIYSMLGVIFILQNDLEKAEESLIKGLYLDKDNFDIHYNLGYVYEKMEYFMDAYIHFYKALKLCNNTNLKEEINNFLINIRNNINNVSNLENYVNSYENIKKIVIVQDIPCIRTHKIAKMIASKGIQVDLMYYSLHPLQVYGEIELPYKNIYKISDAKAFIEFINKSDYDIVYSANEPDYFTVLLLAADKPVIHDTHDMMSIRSKLSNEQIVLEYIANKNAHGNIYVHELQKEIAQNKFGITNKHIFVLNNLIERNLIPQNYKPKLSSLDGKIHCVYEGGLSSNKASHRYLEDFFKRLANENIHVHIYGHVDNNYISNLVKFSPFIHYEGILPPKELIFEMTQYDVGLAYFNVNENNYYHINTVSPNKVYDYLAAGLPIAFSDLVSLKLFNEEYKVGKVIDIKKPLYKQILEITNIKIERDFIVKNNLFINSHVHELIKFFNDVKNDFKKTLSNKSDNKLLIIRSLYSIFIEEFVKRIYENFNIKVDLMTFDDKYKNCVNAYINQFFIINQENFANKIKQLDFYDCINIHYVTPIYAYVIEEIRKKCNMLVVTVWGSDYYRSNNDIREHQRKIYDSADVITFASEEIKNDFLNYYGKDYESKAVVCRFGLTTLEEIDKLENIDSNELKKILEIPDDKLVISIGYNASKEHNHLKIIEEIDKVKYQFNRDVFLLLPMTYNGDEEYKKEVKNKLANLGLEYKVLEDYLPISDFVKYEKVTDIMLQLQTTDALSASMQENLYCGNVVITGSWLPYRILEDNGCWFIKIEKINDLSNIISEVVNNYELYKTKTSNNKKIIYNLSSWRTNIYQWGNLLIK